MRRTSGAVNQPERSNLANAQEVLAVASLFSKAGRTIDSTIVGHSMGGALRPGTRVRVHCGHDAAQPGSIAVIAADGVVFAHRIVGRGRGRRAHPYLLTRGDASVLCDAPSSVNRLIGIVAECDDGSGWRPVSPQTPPSAARRWLAALHRGAMLTALELHVALARRLASLSFGVARALGPLTQFTHGDNYPR